MIYWETFSDIYDQNVMKSDMQLDGYVWNYLREINMMIF